MTRLQKFLENGLLFYDDNKLSRHCKQCNQIVSNTNKRAYEILINNIDRPCDSCRVKNTTKKLSGKMIGENNPFFGKKHTEEHNLKQRQMKLERFQKLGIGNREDIGAKEYFIKLNNLGYDFQPKVFKEIGYIADGYCDKTHSWAEFDTKYHRSPKQTKKDLMRQNNIINYFKKIGNPLNQFMRAYSEVNGDVLFETFISTN